MNYYEPDFNEIFDKSKLFYKFHGNTNILKGIGFNKIEI